MNNKKNQPHYTEAKESAIADILEELHKEGKVFLSYNAKRTIDVNVIIATDGDFDPDSLIPISDETVY